jgi:hypothetical protein
MLLAPPLCLLGDHLGEKLAEPWLERSRMAKLFKGAIIVVTALVTLCVVVMFSAP